MRFPSLGQVSGTDLLRRLASAVAQDRENTAELLFLLAEADRRRLHAREGFPSLFRYCVCHLRMSEDMAYKRILAARVVRKFPAALAGIAAGRLHLTALVMLAPHLTRANAAELLTAAAHRSKPELQELLARHFPQADIPVLVQPVVASDSMVQLVPEPVAPAVLANASNLVEPMSRTSHEASPAHARPCVPPAAASHARVAPLAPERYAVQFTCDRETHDKLRYAQALLGHALPTGSLPEVFTRALDALIDRLERQKFAKGSRMRASSGTEGSASGSRSRSIAARVRLAVWERDGGRCTFVSHSGQACECTTRLEFDHIQPFALGGASTVDNLRLRCRTHNQLAAREAFGRAGDRDLFGDSNTCPAARPERTPIASASGR